jgi:hypothetical protein
MPDEVALLFKVGLWLLEVPGGARLEVERDLLTFFEFGRLEC